MTLGDLSVQLHECRAICKEDLSSTGKFGLCVQIRLDACGMLFLKVHCIAIHITLFHKMSQGKRERERKNSHTIADTDNNTKRQYLLCTRHCSTFHTLTVNPQDCSMYELGAMIKPILQMRKLRHRLL